MNFSRAATLALTAATTATAFTASRSARTFVTQGANSALARTKSIFPSTVSRISRVGVSMNLFSNLFGGGAMEAKVDYTALDYPGPELGKYAEEGKVVINSERDPNLKVASFAGGCFWGLELAYQRVPGVVYTAAGYSQGKEEAPTYNQVCSGATGHTEAVAVYYDPNECTYEDLLDTFFDRVNPTTVNGQGNDFGTQYRTGVYFHTDEQEALAKARFEQEATKYNKPIATELKSAMPFWPAEKYHQQYLEKGGRFNQPQDASKGATETIRCYG